MRIGTPSNERPSILLAEDNSALRDVVTASLRRLEVQVVAESNVRGALSVLEQMHPDLILSDLDLPDGKGFELVNAGRQLNPSMGGIIMTGNSMDNLEDFLQEACHPNAILRKPLTVQNIRQTVSDVLRELIELR